MIFRLILSTEAQKDVVAATDYYKLVSDVVAENFLEILESVYQKLKQSPRHYSFFNEKKTLRSAAFIKFPYSIIFKIQEDTVYIVAIYNTHQNPGNILKRI